MGRKDDLGPKGMENWALVKGSTAAGSAPSPGKTEWRDEWCCTCGMTRKCGLLLAGSRVLGPAEPPRSSHCSWSGALSL